MKASLILASKGLSFSFNTFISFAGNSAAQRASIAAISSKVLRSAGDLAVMRSTVSAAEIIMPAATCFFLPSAALLMASICAPMVAQKPPLVFSRW
ncbi:hypothetical protein [Chromobacterium violaceum]|uniref:hypothetical protein n=1 Tax=Chromobacterium violaceum TaxID=536 RepID=UPI001558A681|nr:hypothetical protein [Chromobacterium violaceum]